MSHYPEANIHSINLILSRWSYCLEADDVNDKAVPKTIEDPFCKHHFSIALTFKTKLIEKWIPHEYIFFVFKIKKCIVHNWEWSHANIIKLINEWLIQRLSTESREKSKVVLHSDVEHIFVEIIEHKKWVPSVCFSSMNKHEGLQELELSNCIVCTSCCLLSFFSKNSYSNMCL